MIVAVRVSSQPGSETVPVTVTVPRSLIGVMALMLTVGATFATFTTAVSVSVIPHSSVTRRPIGKAPSCPTSVKSGVGPVASS